MKPSCREHLMRFALSILMCITSTATFADDTEEAGRVRLLTGNTADLTSGEQIYTQICQGCHMPEGRGAEGAGRYPTLAGNPALASTDYVIVTVLNGRRNMPAFKPIENFEFFFGPTSLDDQQIAEVVNYIRTHFGNDYAQTVSAADVAALHSQP